MTDSRSQALIRELDLQPHPEGGFYREIYRSPETVLPRDGRAPRAALTAIYFLMTAGGRSRWHRLRSGEVWTHLHGSPVRLLLWDGAAREIELASSGGGAFMQQVPAGTWQAAEPLGEYALVACLTAPGFEFEDWELMADSPEAAAALRLRAPELERFL